MSHVHISAEDAGIDTDEGRYVLKVWADDGTEYTVDIHSFVDKFYAAVQANLRPYVLEAESVRHEVANAVAAARATEDSGDGYDRDDPKHPDWFDTLTDWADDQRKRVREGGA